MTVSTATFKSATVRREHALARDRVRALPPVEGRGLVCEWVENPPVELRTMRVRVLLKACRRRNADRLLDLAEADMAINLRQLNVMQRKVLSALLRGTTR